MDSINHSEQPSPSREECKLISCLLPNDGTASSLIQILRDEKKITRSFSTKCMGLAALADAKTKFGELPQPTLVKRVDVVVPSKDANELYDFIYKQASIDRPQGGMIWMSDLGLASPFCLPTDVPFENP
ncbi:MAG: hypothetical protein OCC45_08760 [Desulfotalea sp.]